MVGRPLHACPPANLLKKPACTDAAPRDASQTTLNNDPRRESMNVAYTGRQFEVTPAIRTQVELGLEKIQKLLGNNFDTHVILSVAKHRHIAEITVSVRNHPPIVGLAEAPEMTMAVGNALGRIDRQAGRYKTHWQSKN